MAKMDEQNVQLCRICISNSETTTMISIFGQDLLWRKITGFADVEIVENDHLPQQICVSCAKNVISICLFKKKCEEADSFYRLELLKKLERPAGDVITISENSNSDEDEDEFDFSSIKLADQQNGLINHSSDYMNDDSDLPLIPEIELLTPQDDDNERNVHEIPPSNALQSGYQCSICFETFALKQILKYHMKTLHNQSAPMYECFNCKKTYLYKRFLEKHVRRGRCVQKRRNQTRPMQCTECHVLFPTGHHLGWHKRNGCPSSKIPLQQLFKQNIDQYNNFPVKNKTCKAENVFYMYNRKKFITKPKRKGRTRIKLDSKKIALAKKLILEQATTSTIAQELNISRTFAWRLRKNLVNGVSVHERVIDPDEAAASVVANTGEGAIVEEQKEVEQKQDELEETVFTEIKEEANDEEPEAMDEEDDEDEDEETFHQIHSPQPGCSNQTSVSDEKLSKNSYTKDNKKPRKPNVFLDEEKYAKAKVLLAQNASTLEMARELNVSQMTAWKLRDAISKGIPLTFRTKTETKPKEQLRKMKLPRQRLRAAERAKRDKAITREILTLMKEDINMQYWKISENLSAKGFTMSTSSICQKLKAMGIQRRWKTGDRPPILDFDALKAGSSNEEDIDPYFDEQHLGMSGAHFLSAFTN